MKNLWKVDCTECCQPSESSVDFKVFRRSKDTEHSSNKILRVVELFKSYWQWWKERIPKEDLLKMSLCNRRLLRFWLVIARESEFIILVVNKRWQFLQQEEQKKRQLCLMKYGFILETSPNEHNRVWLDRTREIDQQRASDYKAMIIVTSNYAKSLSCTL